MIFPRGHKDWKKIPEVNFFGKVIKWVPALKKKTQVDFFVKEILAGLTNLHNQEHI